MTLLYQYLMVIERPLPIHPPSTRETIDFAEKFDIILEYYPGRKVPLKLN